MTKTDEEKKAKEEAEEGVPDGPGIYGGAAEGSRQMQIVEGCRLSSHTTGWGLLLSGEVEAFHLARDNDSAVIIVEVPRSRLAKSKLAELIAATDEPNELSWQTYDELLITTRKVEEEETGTLKN
jgi:hypothetical protein